MPNYLEFDLENKHWDSVPFSDAGNSEVEEDTTNAGKAICTNANGKLDNSFLAHDTDIKNLNVSDTFTFWTNEWEISSSGNINAYGNRIESFADNTRYDAWNTVSGGSHVCVDFGSRRLLPRSGFTYHSSLDWSDENCVKTRVIDDSAGLNWGFFARTDFSSGGTDGKGFFPIVNTTGGGFETVAQDPSTLNGCFVFLQLHTSTSSTGASQARGNTGFQLKTSFATYEWGSKVKVPSLSTSTEEFSVQVGIQSSLISTNALSSRNHIIFHYDRSTYSDDNWRAVTRTSSDSGTVTDTGVSASDSFQKLYFMVDQDNSAARVRFYINGTLVATHTTNIPEDVGLHPRLAILKSVGTTNRAVHLDYMYHRMKFLSHQDRV
jgi:hypothetical protein